MLPTDPQTFAQLSAAARQAPDPSAPLRPLGLYLMGDTATQFLATALRGEARAYGYDLAVTQADFDQVATETLDPSSGLYTTAAPYVLVFNAVSKLHRAWHDTPPGQRPHFAETRLHALADVYHRIAQRLPKTRVLLTNYPETDDGVWGNYANKLDLSFLYQLRKLNLHLMDLAAQHPNLWVLDLQRLQNRLGHERFFSPKLYVHGNVDVHLEALPAVARATLQTVAALQGQFHKCLILDLDNTLWGGVIGDDGMEGIQIGELGIGKAYSAVQRWALELKNRGIILAVCSKNTEHIAREPFERHPDMVLRPDDIAVFVANWENKADNIRYIQEVLNIGFDSMVYLDDNPFERNLVRQALPQITIPELPADPAEWPRHLAALNLFETASYTAADTERTRQYQAEAARLSAQRSYASIDEYLQSLDMVSECGPVDAFNTPRVAQLTQRSNQFNLRTLRYTDDDITRLRTSPQHIVRYYKLADKYGDHGLISALILAQQPNGTDWLIDTWVMSCRVLKRGVEHFIINDLVAEVRARGGQRLIGEYLPTPKNDIVARLYPDLGFAELEPARRWALDVTTHQPVTVYIRAQTA